MTCPSNTNPTTQIALKVNGHEIVLNAFVQRFVIETVCGMLRALHGVEEVQTVDLAITREPLQGKSD